MIHKPTDGMDDINWAPRVPKRKIRRLYELEAKGVLDEELIEDVGFTLLLRCESILTIREAREGRVRCPRCERSGVNTIIKRSGDGGPDEVVVCPQCDWRVTWGGYHATWKGKQLYSGSAVRGFETYARVYPTARTPKDKILAIDRLIHEFHHWLSNDVVLPTRSAAVNLIEGKLTDVVRFLDELTYGEGLPEEVETRRDEWRSTLDRQPWKSPPAAADGDS